MLDFRYISGTCTTLSSRVTAKRIFVHMGYVKDIISIGEILHLVFLHS